MLQTLLNFMYIFDPYKIFFLSRVPAVKLYNIIRRCLMQRCRHCNIPGVSLQLHEARKCPEYLPPWKIYSKTRHSVAIVRLQDGCQEPRTSNCHLLEPSLTLVNLGSNKTKLGKSQWIIIKSFRSVPLIFLKMLKTCNKLWTQYSWT